MPGLSLLFCISECILNSKLVWMVVVMIVNLPSTSRSRAAVARRAHNPKVGGSNPPFATNQISKPLLIRGFVF